MRVALNLEQLLQPAPGGIGRYTAELARLLPALPAGEGDEITLVPFVARHRRDRWLPRWTTSWPIPGLLSATLPRARAIGSPVRRALRESPRFFSTFSSHIASTGQASRGADSANEFSRPVTPAQTPNAFGML